jgi:cell division septal protein FtsQ
MSKKSPLKATKLHQRKRRARIIKATILLVFVLSIFGLTVWFSHSALFRIENVQVEGNVAIDAQDIEHLAQKHLAGTFAAVYARSNKVFYPKDEIEQDIRTTFPNIETLHVETEGKTLAVTISERKPAYIWCKGKPEIKSTDACYFIDAAGYIFSKGPQVSGNAYFTFFGLITDENPIGKTFLNEAEIKTIDSLKTTLIKNDVPVDALIATDSNLRELTLAHGGKILYKADQDQALIASSLELLKKKTTLLNSNAPKKIEYIDLRFGNKVYYKFIGDNAVQTEQ